MFKTTVTDMETGTIMQEATGECIIAAATERKPDNKTKTDIIRAYVEALRGNVEEANEDE